MSRKNLRTQLEELRREKEQLETDNEAARKNEADLSAELERLRTENERLSTEKREATDADEQRQMYEDIQTELAEAVERGNSLEDRCSSLEDRLVQVLEEGELERLKAVEAVRVKFEDALLQQVQELQRQVAKLQSPTSDGSAPGNHDNPSKETTEKSTNQSTNKVEPVVTTDSSGGDQAQTSSSNVVVGTPSKQSSATSNSPELSAALLAQQLPPLPKFSGNSDDESFQEWIAQFELVAEVCQWKSQTKLIHLTTRLRGEAFAFYRSCSKSQKADYDQLVKELTRRFTPVRIQSVQTSLFHERKQGDHETVDSYAQDLKSKFHKAYPQATHGEAAESMGKSILASQFIAGLVPSLKSKVAGGDGGFDEALVKARFEEAKVRDLNPKSSIRNSKPSNESTNKSVTFAKQQSTDRSKLLECKRCGGTNHIAKFCRSRGRAEPAEARGGSSRSQENSVRAVVHPGAASDATPASPLNPDLDRALTDITTTMHTITSQQNSGSPQLGPTLTAEIQIEGCPVTALLDTGSPATIVSLEFLLRTLAKQKREDETPQAWRARVEKKLEPPGIPLRSYGGQPLNIVGQVTVDICRGAHKANVRVHIQQGAPVCVLVGTDVLPKLGFVLLESGAGDVATDYLSQQETNDRPPTTTNNRKLEISPGTVKLITATRVPARHVRIVKAKLDGVAQGSVALLTAGDGFEERGLRITESLLEPDGEHCVHLPIQNVSCTSICLDSGAMLGQVQPVTIVTDAEEIVEQITGEAELEGVVKHVTGDEPVGQIPRESKLLESVHVEESLSTEQMKQLRELIVEYADVFALDQHELGTTDLVTHVIDTGDSSPIKQPPRRVPFALRAKVDQLVNEMLDHGVITPSKSPWGSPVVLVTKKDGSSRFCVDYRRLNAVTKTDVFPLPRVDDSLDQLANSHFFTTLDLAAGYWQVLVDPQSREKTAFVTHSGLYEFSVMPFGLKNAPATFQRLMETVLAGLNRKVCLDYLDDIIVTGETFSEHLVNLRLVLLRLRDAGLRLKSRKCYFAMKEVEYLGYRVSESGISADPVKVRAVNDFPRPRDLKRVRSFLGLASYYRRFIPEFSKIAAPLYCLTRKDAPFIWTDACEKAFVELKTLLTNAPILAFPNFSRDFHLETDASGLGLGAVLSQEQSDGTTRPIAYASRTLQPHERNYAATEMEALGVVWAVKHFRQYLYGHRCHVHTDHEALKSLLNSPHPSGKLARWGLAIQELDLVIHYKPGRVNQKADALSRAPFDQPPVEVSEQSRVAAVQSSPPSPAKGGESPLELHQREDATLAPYFAYLEQGVLPEDDVMARELALTKSQFQIVDGVLHHVEKDKTLRVIPPQSNRKELFDGVHGGKLGGHLRDAKIHSVLSKHYWWPGMRTDICKWCRGCITCATRQTGRATRPPLVPIPVDGPFDRIGVDVIQFPKSRKGNRYAVCFIDYLTKWVEAFATTDQSALTIAKLLVEEIIPRHGVPKELLSDRGAAFLSNLLHEVYRLLGTHKVSTTAYHPQTDGLVERFHRTLTSMLAKSTQPSGLDWDERLPYVLFAYRCSEQGSTRESPFFMLYGRDPILPTPEALSKPVDRCYLDADDYRSRLVQNLSEAWERARKNVQKAQKLQKKYHDKRVRMPTFTEGGRVFVYMPAARSGKAYKLSRPFHGPYRITKMYENGADVRPVDKPKDKPIRVALNRLRVCADEMSDEFWPPRGVKVNAKDLTPDTPMNTVWRGRLRSRQQ